MTNTAVTQPRIVFAGTPEFAAVHLRALIGAGITPVAVYTQPDRPAGRGQKAQISAVKSFAQTHNVRIEQPLSLKDSGAQQTLQSLRPDLIVVVAYGLLLPQIALDIPRHGCVNVHASLLPRWRGAAPIQRALMAGDTLTGVALMHMEAGLDTGPTFASVDTVITGDDTFGSLHDRLATLGAQLLLDNLFGLLAGHLIAQPQATEGITYARKIEKAETHIDWTHSALTIESNIRAFQPAPVANSMLHGELVKFHKALVITESIRGEDCDALPGTIVSQHEDALLVACGDGILAISEMQLAGGKRLPVRDLLHSKRQRFAVGERFGATQLKSGKIL